MSDVGDVLYDKDAVYINVPGIYSSKPKKPESLENEEEEEEEENVKHNYTEGDQMVLDLQQSRVTIDSRMEESTLQIFPESGPIKPKEIQVFETDPSDPQNGNLPLSFLFQFFPSNYFISFPPIHFPPLVRVRRKAAFGNEDSEDEDGGSSEGEEDEDEEDNPEDYEDGYGIERDARDEEGEDLAFADTDSELEEESEEEG